VDDISSMRGEIDSIDEKLVELFEKRMEIVLRVAKYKRDNNMEVADSSRESEVIKKSVKRLQDKRFEKSLKYFMEYIMKLSRDMEHELMDNLEH
jgi:chorismate mutase/prephenate dehydratase